MLMAKSFLVWDFLLWSPILRGWFLWQADIGETNFWQALQTLQTERVFVNQPPTNLSKLCLDFSAGACRACPGVLVHAPLQILPDLRILVSFLWRVGSDVVRSGFVLTGNWLGRRAKCKAGKHSQVPWCDTAWDLIYESKYLSHIYTSLWREVINEQQRIILFGISICFCVVRNPEIVVPLNYPKFSNVFHI